jgi:hypothetical protein
LELCGVGPGILFTSAREQEAYNEQPRGEI